MRCRARPPVRTRWPGSAAATPRPSREEQRREEKSRPVEQRLLRPRARHTHAVSYIAHVRSNFEDWFVAYERVRQMQDQAQFGANPQADRPRSLRAFPPALRGRPPPFSPAMASSPSATPKRGGRNIFVPVVRYSLHAAPAPDPDLRAPRAGWISTATLQGPPKTIDAARTTGLERALAERVSLRDVAHRQGAKGESLGVIARDR